MITKTRFILVFALLMTVLLTGCAVVQESVPAETTPTEVPQLFIVGEPEHHTDPKIYAINPNEVTSPDVVDIPEESVPMAQTPGDLNPTPENPLTERQAEALAIHHAGLAHEDVRFLFSKQDYEDGVPVIEVSFISGSYSYEYEIASETGEILSFDMDSTFGD